MVTTASSSSIVVIALLGYFAFSVWNAYSAGCNRGMIKKQEVKGIARYGPFLSLGISFVGIALAVFLFYELVFYYTGFIKANLPAELGNLNFLTFLIRQFESANLSHAVYVRFLGLGFLISCFLAFFLVRFLYHRGFQKTSS